MATRCIHLEVCLGVDCFGAGGGAALLELEELAQEAARWNDKQQTIVTMTRGACRNACTVGPNVYRNGEEHWTHVKDPAACANIVATPEPHPSSACTATQMMLRKARRQRWQWQRQVARFVGNYSNTATTSTNKTAMTTQREQQLRQELDACLAVEEAAVRRDDELMQRAQRRRQRLAQRFHQVVNQGLVEK